MGKDLLNLRGRLRLMVRESATPSLFTSSSRLRITGTLTFKFEEITEVCFCHSKETETHVFLLKMQVTHPFPKKRGEPRQSRPAQLSSVAQLDQHESLVPEVHLLTFLNYRTRHIFNHLCLLLVGGFLSFVVFVFLSFVVVVFLSFVLFCLFFLFILSLFYFSV